MKRRYLNSAGFTLVELMIGMSLSAMIMAAVLSSYVFLARNFTRTLGVNSGNQPAIEAQGRRSLLYFEQDVRMAISLSGTPSASSVSFTIPGGTGTATVTYAYTTTALTSNSVSVPANCLYRVQGTSTRVLHTGLLSCTFSYYDASGNPYTSYTNYTIGIKQISMNLTAQGGSSANGTLTPVYVTASRRVLMRNRQYLQ